MTGTKEPLSFILALSLLAALFLAPSGVEAGDCSTASDGSHFEMGEPAVAISMSGGMAYAVGTYFQFIGWGGIYRINFDVFDLDGSVQRSSTPIQDSPCVAVDRGYAYLGGLEFRVLDVSDPAAPRIVGTRSTANYIWGISVNKGRAYLADEAGLTIMDIGDPTSPMPIGSVAIASARSVAAKGSYAYVATGGGVTVVDVSNPAAPVVVGTCATPGSPSDIAIRGAHAYVVDRAGFRVIDIARSAAPRLIGGLDGIGDAGAVAIGGERAYVADWGDAAHGTNLRVLDISDPAHPRLVNSVAGRYEVTTYWGLGHRVERVSVSNGRVAVGGTLDRIWLGDCIAGLSGCDGTTGYLDVAPAENYEACSVAAVGAAAGTPMRLSGIHTPTAFALLGNGPNPFNPETSIRYNVPRASRVRIRIHDIHGRLVETLVDGLVDRGEHQVSWRGRTGHGDAVASGVYIVTMEVEGFRQARRITLLK